MKNRLLAMSERWRNLADKLRWRAMSDRNKGDAKESTMHDTTANCLEMCADQIDNELEKKQTK